MEALLRLRCDTPPASPAKAAAISPFAGGLPGGAFAGGPSRPQLSASPRASAPWALGAAFGATSETGDTTSCAVSPSPVAAAGQPALGQQPATVGAAGSSQSAAPVVPGALSAMQLALTRFGAEHRRSYNSSADSGAPLLASMHAAAAQLRQSDDTSPDAWAELAYPALMAAAAAGVGAATDASVHLPSAPGAARGASRHPPQRRRKPRGSGWGCKEGSADAKFVGAAGGARGDDDSDSDYVPGCEEHGAGSAGAGAHWTHARPRGGRRGWSYDIVSDGAKELAARQQALLSGSGARGAPYGEEGGGFPAGAHGLTVGVVLPPPQLQPRAGSASPASPCSGGRCIRVGRTGSKEPKPCSHGPW